MKYIQSFLKKSCAEDLVYLFGKSGNPAKEITESYGAWRNMILIPEFIDIPLNIHIGDGSKCLTGALFSYMTPSVNVSIDPMINIKFMNAWVNAKNVKRFDYYKNKFQSITERNILTSFSALNNNLVCKNHYNIILVHSHVSVEEVDKHYPNWKFMYVNPCCMRNSQIFPLTRKDIKVLKFGKDNNILSDKNEVIIYEKSLHVE